MAITARAAARAHLWAAAQQPATISATEGTSRWTCTTSHVKSLTT
jgi:hypothetical protein